MGGKGRVCTDVSGSIVLLHGHKKQYMNPSENSVINIRGKNLLTLKRRQEKIIQGGKGSL